MYTQIFTGNLTDVATFQKFDEQKSVVNFTVAVNFLTGKKDENGNYKSEVTYFPCSKWIKGNEKPKWFEYLLKGQKVLIESNYFKVSTSEKDGHTYQNFKVYVERLEILGGKKESNQEPEQVLDENLS